MRQREETAKQSRRCGWNLKEENQAGLVLLIFLPAVTRRPLYTCQASSLIYELWPYNTCASDVRYRAALVFPSSDQQLQSSSSVGHQVEFLDALNRILCILRRDWTAISNGGAQQSESSRNESERAWGAVSLSQVQWKMENRNMDLIWTWIRIQESFNFE